MVIVASKAGRLANRLFTFAHLAASAREHGYEVWNPAFDEYAELFPALAGDGLCRFPPRPARLARPALRHGAFFAFNRLAAVSARIGGPVPVIRLAHGEELDIGSRPFVERARRGPVLVQGWLFRDEASVARHGDEVRAFFRPQERHLAAAARAAERARDGADVLVGVHVRRGDYRRWREGLYFWEADAYAGIMERAGALFPERRVAYLVCSDEPMEGLPGSPGTGHLLEDLYALALCDYLIGPPSTYSAWASFYGRVPLRAVSEPLEPFELDDFAVAE